MAAKSSSSRPLRPGPAMPMDVAVLVYPGCMGTEVFAFADMMLIANHLSTALDTRSTPTPVATRMVCARRGDEASSIPLAGGFVLPAQAAATGQPPDLLVVPGLEVSRYGQWPEKLAPLQPEMNLIRRWHAGGTHLACVCVGTFLLAEAGVLTGRSVTTAWPFEQEFRQRYPQVHLDAGAVLCRDKELLSTGAVTSVFDLALAVIEQHAGERVAQACARMALVNQRRTSQQPYVDSRLLIPGDRLSLSARVQRWLTARIAEPYRLADLAAHFHISPRTLLRRYQQETSDTPLRWLQRARVEKARRLLESSSLNLASIVEKVGYEDAATFSRLFLRHTGESPARYRRMHGAARR